jgi:hypothetical protein
MRCTNHLRVFGLTLCGVLAVGCTNTLNEVRLRAAQQLRCPESDVRVERLAANGYRAFACGQVVDYVCVVDRRGEATCVAERGVGPQSPQSTPASLPTTWTDAQMQDLVRRTATPLRSCLTAEGAGVEIGLTVARDGRVLVGEVTGDGTDDEQLECIRQVLRRTVVRGRVMESRSMQIRAGSSAAAPDRTAGAEVESLESTTVRAAIAGRASAVLACTEGEAIAIEARWSTDGHVTISLGGARAGTRIEGCVRAAVGEITLDAPATPGSVLQPIAR